MFVCFSNVGFFSIKSLSFSPHFQDDSKEQFLIVRTIHADAASLRPCKRCAAAIELLLGPTQFRPTSNGGEHRRCAHFGYGSVT